ncbi:MAG: STAS domain-containing protein [Tannerellaceae bacterium]|nr:STAS domain-containing protein [Tannerellaceae bacterium]
MHSPFTWLPACLLTDFSIENGEALTVSLSGQLDTLTSADFEKEIRNILRSESPAVVLNGKMLTYISSAGLRLLLHLHGIW